MQGWISPSGKKSFYSCIDKEEVDPFFFTLSSLTFTAVMAESGLSLAFPCPKALGMSDEDSFPVGQKKVQDGLISLCFLKLLMLKPMASSQFLGNTQAGAELVRVVSALRLDSGGGFH